MNSFSTQALIITQTVATLIGLMVVAAVLTHVIMGVDRKIRVGRETSRHHRELQASMLTIVWQNPTHSSDGEHSVVRGEARIFTQDDDGRIISERNTSRFETDIPVAVAVDEDITELSVVLHHGKADSFNLVLASGNQVACQIMA